MSIIWSISMKIESINQSMTFPTSELSSRIPSILTWLVNLYGMLLNLYKLID